MKLTFIGVEGIPMVEPGDDLVGLIDEALAATGEQLLADDVIVIAQKIISKAEVGNIYINRNMIGAVVGVQPFGGFEKSGTGPKAGGPEYLKRLCYEQSISNNTAAMGGNASLLAEVDD